MRERLLLLAMAYPEYSKKYGDTICTAGITESGTFRRVYPIPNHIFYEGKLHKRHYIEYNISSRSNADYRKESRKIEYENIIYLEGDAPYRDIRKLCNEHVTTLAFLEQKWKIDKTSLGIIKPEIKSIRLVENIIDKKNQDMRLPGYNKPERLKHKIICTYFCGDGKIHKCSIVDTEFGQLYRNLNERNLGDKEKIQDGIRKKIEWMVKERDIYFMVGTVFKHPNHWTIISVLYPEKLQEHTLSEY